MCLELSGNGDVTAKAIFRVTEKEKSENELDLIIVRYCSGFF